MGGTGSKYLRYRVLDEDEYENGGDVGGDDGGMMRNYANSQISMYR